MSSSQDQEQPMQQKQTPGQKAQADKFKIDLSKYKKQTAAKQVNSSSSPTDQLK